MHSVKVFTIIALVAGAFAWAPPPKPVIQHVAAQANYCGTGTTAYCCNTEGNVIGATSCTVVVQGQTCGTTIVCCNAQDSVQACTGNLNIIG